ncbi:MAG TPA: hypothetical protein VGM89_15915 [Puia sp.]
MPALFLYLLKLTISLSITWLFYRFVLRSLTFHRLNRWYLLGSAADKNPSAGLFTGPDQKTSPPAQQRQRDPHL